MTSASASSGTGHILDGLRGSLLRGACKTHMGRLQSFFLCKRVLSVTTQPLCCTRLASIPSSVPKRAPIDSSNRSNLDSKPPRRTTKSFSGGDEFLGAEVEIEQDVGV